ncbi:protein DOWNSTREAM OF FLC [Mercurialis annua]|uniref:protein DOWNSTREAM OF FLC n=1 Tax=Mercurialis annua TaxID=3986 RepID=UPI00215FF22C|nr:protein DOWNSTREAM OF FLC [Mercurialis annua]
MSRQFLLFFALLFVCAVPALVSARLLRRPFHIRGRAFCDTCRCGFETNKTTYIPGAKVRIECEDRTTFRLKYSVEGVTNSEGTFNIKVEDDHEDEICYVSLVSSPWPSCAKPNAARNSSQVILTRNNGAIADLHYANSLGFLRDEPMSGCEELVKYLLESDI